MVCRCASTDRDLTRELPGKATQQRDLKASAGTFWWIIDSLSTWNNLCSAVVSDWEVHSFKTTSMIIPSEVCRLTGCTMSGCYEGFDSGVLGIENPACVRIWNVMDITKRIHWIVPVSFSRILYHLDREGLSVKCQGGFEVEARVIRNGCYCWADIPYRPYVTQLMAVSQGRLGIVC